MDTKPVELIGLLAYYSLLGSSGHFSQILGVQLVNVALVGHPLSGKSTLFSALTGIAPAEASGYSEKGHVGMVEVADPRLDWLGQLCKARKITHASLEFTDLPGLSFDKPA